MKDKVNMSYFKIGNSFIGRNYPCFVIAEIGQNHQGDINIAKEMILKAKEAGADCVKFQKSHLPSKFSKSALNRPYESENSFGRTYGEHKAFLEFSMDEFKSLKEYSSEIGIMMTASAMDIKSFDDLIDLNVPFIKIGSGDANNLPFIKYATMPGMSSRPPLIISTGMQRMETINRIHSILNENKFNGFCLMHCVSSYPTKPENVHLKLLNHYKMIFPDTIIGYSGHEEGILISLVAVLLGAKVIERHFTLDKTQKGSDHKCSLTPNELKLLIKYIRLLELQNGVIENSSHYNDPNAIINLFKELDIINTNIADISIERITNDIVMAMGEIKDRDIMPCELECLSKLGKSLVYKNDKKIGEIITEDDLTVKVSEPSGIRPEIIEEIFGKFLIKDVFFDMPVLENDFTK